MTASSPREAVGASKAADRILTVPWDIRLEALRIIGRQLRECLALAASAFTAENIALAAIARDHAAELTLRHDVEVVRHFFLSPTEDALLPLFADGSLVATLLNLPAPASGVQALWDDTPAADDRRFFAGLLLRLPQDLDDLSDRLRDQRYADLLIQYVAWQPKCFASEAERQRYYDHTTSLCLLCAELLEGALAPSLLRLLSWFVCSLSCGSIYSCDGSLIALAKAKARMIEAFMRTTLGIDASDSPRPVPLRGAGPIRLGLLWNDVDWRTEHIVGVASTRLLRDHGFHVISILHHRSKHGSGASQATMFDDIAALSDEVVDLDDRPALLDKSAAIKALDLDCLLFMNNVTFGYNEYVALAAMRLARWQAVNFCAVFTTGFSTVDLYVSGAISERSAAPEENYTERLVRLPGSCLIFDHTPRRQPSRHHAIADQLHDPAASTLFASGANLYKIHSNLTQTWSRVLAAVPRSRLLLYPFNPNWDLTYPVDKFLRRFESQLVRHGVDPERVVIAGPWHDAGAIDELLDATDIYLDSFPHSGGLSSLDALKLGVPVVTLQGETQRENQSADLLDLLGLSHFVSRTVDDYVALAVRLARDPDLLASYRVAILRGIGSAPFFDTQRYGRDFAASLRKVLVDA